MTRVHGRYPRVPCLVPFCRCGATCYAPFEGLEIICPKHYRLVDRSLKALRRRAHREMDKADRFANAHPGIEGRPAHFRALRMQRLANGCWRRMRAQAIERAAV